MLTGGALALCAAALAAPPTRAGWELRYADLQSAVLELDEGRAARTQLRAAREQAQMRIDGLRAALQKERSTLSPDVFRARAQAVEAEAEAAEADLEQLQEELLRPMLSNLARALAKASKGGRVVLRLDEVPLIGWPRACDVTPWLLTRVQQASDPIRRPLTSRRECSVTKLRLIDLPALAVESAVAQKAQARVEAFRDRKQTEIDSARERVEGLERAGAESAPAARRALDERVLNLKAALDRKKTEAEDAVFEALIEQLEAAAARLEGVAVADATHAETPIPCEDGQGWARKVLGISPPKAARR